MKVFRIIAVSFVAISACHLQLDTKQDVTPNASRGVTTYLSSPKSIPHQLDSGPADANVSRSQVKSGTNADTVTNEVAFQEFSQTGIKKRIIITVAETPSHKFSTKAIPGIEWIEQMLDSRTFLKVSFENDLITFANTDRYFTNGIQFNLQAAWLAGLPFQKLMIPYRKTASVSYNLSLVQNIYTPTDTRVAPELTHDRPYASVLYFGFRKKVADPRREIKLSSEINVGYIGPYSLGSSLQSFIHKAFPSNDKPMGWDTQINSDMILNYSAQLQKALIKKEKFSLLAGLDAGVGTLYTNAGAGLQLQAGKSEPVFGLGENQHRAESEYYFFTKTSFSFVVFNALLQGGMFNHDNSFTLSHNEIQRFVGNAEAGIHFRYKGIGIEIAQHFISPEYKGGLWHKWGRMSLIFKW